MDRLSLAKDDLAAVLRAGFERTRAMARGQLMFGIGVALTTAVLALAFGQPDDPLELLVLATGGFAGFLALHFVYSCILAPYRLTRQIPVYRGNALAADTPGFVAGFKVVGLRGRLFFTLTTTGEVPTGRITCEFAYPRLPWSNLGPLNSAMLWWGEAHARFPEGSNVIEVEYPTDFDSDSPAFDFDPPEIEPFDRPYSLFWKDEETDEYIVRYQLAVEERS